MMPMANDVKVWLATGHTNMRRGFSGPTTQIPLDFAVSASIAVSVAAPSMARDLPRNPAGLTP